ncbi:MAG: hypothetical protein ACM30H_08080 [Clostridia bacterium]
MGSSLLRSRVYLAVVHRENTMHRILDLSWLGGRPIAVISWVNRDGQLRPGHYIELDPAKLRKSAPVGTYWYDAPVQDPRVPPRAPH